MLVIDEKGENLGEMDTREAVALARSRELDLVEVSPKANPPVCRITDFGKFQYQKSKQERQSKAGQKKTLLKEVRFGFRTDTHDLEFKQNNAEKFLQKGNKVKIDVVLKGREKAHRNIARENLSGFLAKITTPHKIEEPIKSAPFGFTVTIAPE